MRRLMRAAAALAVAMAVAALPIVLDRCADTCEMHKAGSAVEPSCHHVRSATTHIGVAPVPCGHDHHLVVATAAPIVRSDVGFEASAAIEAAGQPVADVLRAVQPVDSSPPAVILSPTRSIAPLRV